MDIRDVSLRADPVRAQVDTNNRGADAAEDALMEIQGCGIFDLLVNGIKTRKDAAKATQIVDAQAKFYERIGPKVIRLLKRCRTGEAIEARDAEKLIR